MTKQELLDAIPNAYETRTRLGIDYEVIKDDAPAPVRDILMKVSDAMYEDCKDLDLAHDITARAALLGGYRLVEEDAPDPSELAQNTASPYTARRLEYITVHNQDDISELMKEYELDDIATAAAVWYENRVAEAVRLILDAITDNADEDAG